MTVTRTKASQEATRDCTRGRENLVDLSRFSLKVKAVAIAVFLSPGCNLHGAISINHPISDLFHGQLIG